MTLVPHPDVIRPSVRQYEVLQQFLKDGADNVTIGLRLGGVSEDTVKSHMKKLLRLAGVHNRAALAVAVLGGHVVVKIPAGGQ